MKLFIGLFVATLALNGVLSLPARNPSDDAEVIDYPRRVSTQSDDDGFNDFKGVIDTGSGYPFLQPNPSVLNFGFFDSFDDILRRFRARLWPVSILGRGGEESDEDTGSGGFGLTTSFDPKKGKTTSTVKVIDGHKVEVNETVYGDEGNVFRVRVVNVRPLEDGENVEETVKTSGGENDDGKPSTSRPEIESAASDEEEEGDGKREPLAKKSSENEIQGNIDDPEHSTATEGIVEATTTIGYDNDEKDDAKDTQTMLPTTTEDALFVTDNTLAALSDTDGDGNGNNEFETNMSSLADSAENAGDLESNDAEATTIAADAAAPIENNEDTEEVNDNLNESSSTSEAEGDADAGFDERSELEDVEAAENDDSASMAQGIINSNVKHSNYAVIRNSEREDASSSDDESPSDRAGMTMHPNFYAEWGASNENIDNAENNDLSNDIDVYDVEPIDLSNDIAVNEAADLPLNPDAEFIDVYGSKQTLAQMPKFEKLSLSAVPADNAAMK